MLQWRTSTEALLQIKETPSKPFLAILSSHNLLAIHWQVIINAGRFQVGHIYGRWSIEPTTPWLR